MEVDMYLFFLWRCLGSSPCLSTLGSPVPFPSLSSHLLVSLNQGAPARLSPRKPAKDLVVDCISTCKHQRVAQPGQPGQPATGESIQLLTTDQARQATDPIQIPTTLARCRQRAAN
jgi:hypothetical protein